MAHTTFEILWICSLLLSFMTCVLMFLLLCRCYDKQTYWGLLSLYCGFVHEITDSLSMFPQMTNWVEFLRHCFLVPPFSDNLTSQACLMCISYEKLVKLTLVNFILAKRYSYNISLSTLIFYIWQLNYYNISS